jgi:branched-chain amino acid transport system ATP-binding protein
MRLCERIQVLDYGKTISIGNPGEVRNDPAVLTAYLGRRVIDVEDR